MVLFLDFTSGLLLSGITVVKRMRRIYHPGSMKQMNHGSEANKIEVTQTMNRRTFIKRSALTVIGTQLPAAALLAQGDEKEKEKGSVKTQEGGMLYRSLGKTGLKLSEISLGGSPVPPEPVFVKALEMGVNYIDTSSSYMNGNSERMIGKLIKGKRDRFHVATKVHTGRKGRSRKELILEAEGSLARLGSDYVDIMLVHGASSPEILADEEVLAAFEKLKKDGKIRFTGASCHRDPVKVLSPAIESGLYDMVTIGYNAYSGIGVKDGEKYDDYLAVSGIEKVISFARKKNVGVIAMKTMAGGERQNLKRFETGGSSLAQAKLKWVLENRGVCAIITEMLSFDVLNENLSVSGKRISSREKEELEEHVKATSRGYCRMCGRCASACPSGIKIPDILRFAAYYNGYGKKLSARQAYRNLPSKRTVSGCEKCGRCEAGCPFEVRVVEKLGYAHAMLA